MIIDKKLVSFWTEFINWPKRIEGDNGFIERALHRQECRRVFDAALGDGIDSIILTQAGFDVTGNDIDPNFRKVARKNAKKHRVEFKVTDYDWREIPDEETEQYDAVLCLGNSLTYLFDKKDQEKAIRNFVKMIRPGGLIVIDQRNYDYILREREYILRNPRENFRYKRKFNYCSETISGYPVVIKDDLVIFEYRHEETGKIAHLELYPFRRKELVELMQKIGLKVETFSDFHKFKRREVDFYQHIGIKLSQTT